MTKGLIKSFSLHLGVLILFVYGAELFKQNKNFEIYEIPLDIIDISEITVSKIDKNPSPKSRPKTSNFFSPPTPQSKPKPPEYNIKSENKKNQIKTEKEEIISKKEKKKRMESILKSIEKIKSQNQTKQDDTEEDLKDKDLTENMEEKRLGDKLTLSEEDAIKRQFYRCWIVPAGAKNLKDLVVSIKISLNQEGEVISSKLINARNKDPFFRAASESAIRAVNHPECKKLKVPKKKYEIWNEIILDFDPSQNFN